MGNFGPPLAEANDYLLLIVYLGKSFRLQSAIVFGMGFATNVLSLPGLLGPGTLALSDANNHASLILGLRMSRATVRVFRHNDVRHLERQARRALAERHWTNIVIVRLHPLTLTPTHPLPSYSCLCSTSVLIISYG